MFRIVDLFFMDKLTNFEGVISFFSFLNLSFRLVNFFTVVPIYPHPSTTYQYVEVILKVGSHCNLKYVKNLYFYVSATF